LRQIRQAGGKIEALPTGKPMVAGAQHLASFTINDIGAEGTRLAAESPDRSFHVSTAGETQARNGN
jgi:hypothetical protein